MKFWTVLHAAPAALARSPEQRGRPDLRVAEESLQRSACGRATDLALLIANGKILRASHLRIKSECAASRHYAEFCCALKRVIQVRGSNLERLEQWRS
eukprot:scaffold754_cov248-Pinguiococcus_pyrenoidosus.AAC.31